jgi:hypothetical protein
MKLSPDDWMFKPSDPDQVLVSLFLNNGQHALLEINPVHISHAGGPQVPEIIVHCELPGEKLTDPKPSRRWIARPPDRTCQWSRVELPPTLTHQIEQRIEHVHP